MKLTREYWDFDTMEWLVAPIERFGCVFISNGTYKEISENVIWNNRMASFLRINQMVCIPTLDWRCGYWIKPDTKRQ